MQADKPILMSAEMVRATLREIEKPGTGKTQTRRAINPQPRIDAQGNWCQEKWNYGQSVPGPSYKNFANCKCPYGKRGDLLWVRETFTEEACATSVCYKADFPIIWPADQTEDGEEIIQEAKDYKFRPSIFLPRWASRLTLQITDIRVERLQDISEDDARAEGVTPTISKKIHGWGPHSLAFSELWDELNRNRLLGWVVNPWVWAITFKPHLCNIDDFIREQAA